MKSNLDNTKIEQRIIDALEKEQGRPPRKQELGGGYYYKCYWVSCNEDVNKFFNYCPKCGTRIQWDDA